MLCGVANEIIVTAEVPWFCGSGILGLGTGFVNILHLVVEILITMVMINYHL